MGDKVLMDGWNDTIDPLCGKGIGGTAENLHEKFKIPRKEQDAFAYLSMEKAKHARDNGLFDNEIVPVRIETNNGDLIELSRDESIMDDTNLVDLADLPPVFKEGGKEFPLLGTEVDAGGIVAAAVKKNDAVFGGVFQPVGESVEIKTVFFRVIVGIITDLEAGLA